MASGVRITSLLGSQESSHVQSWSMAWTRSFSSGTDAKFDTKQRNNQMRHFNLCCVRLPASVEIFNSSIYDGVFFLFMIITMIVKS